MRAAARLRTPGAALAVLVLLGAGAGLWWTRGAAPVAQGSAPALRAGAFDPPHTAPEIALQGSDGSAVTLARYRGKVVLMAFGFTYCAAVCPTTLATLAQARAALGAAGSQVQVVFVTVDPARDDAAHLKQYLAAFDSGFIGATGAPDALAAARAGYGVTATKQGSGDNYAFAHTSSIFLIDRAGTLRGVMPYGHAAEDFVHDVRYLLAH